MNTTVTRGKIAAAGARIRGGRTIAEVQMLDGETRTRVELLLPMGVTAVPRPGADVVVLEIGSRDHLVALLADDPALRIGGLGPGEIGLRDERGQQVTLTPGGVRITGALSVTIVSVGEVLVEAPKLKIQGDAEVTGTLVVDGITINTHRHGGVVPGSGESGGPVN